MTIVVMFGMLDKFRLEKNTCFSGNEDDRFWVVEDKLYPDTEALLELPVLQQDTPLPVLFHNSSPGFHVSQRQWLARIKYGGNGYKPYQSGLFSHYGELYETIKSWGDSVPLPTDISNVLAKYGNIVHLGLLDELAAWNLLALTGDEEAKAERTRCRNLVSSFAPDLDLNQIPPGEWLPLLEKKAQQFC